MSIKDKYNEQRPTVPTIFVSAEIPDEAVNDVYVLYCKKMEWNIDCFVQTAVVNMVGEWKNQTDLVMNGVFMIPMRGNVTDCYIHLGSDRVRMVGLAERELPRPITYNQPTTAREEKEDEVVITISNQSSNRSNRSSTHRAHSDEWELMDPMFCQQVPGYFRIPFDGIKPKQSIRVDLYYSESLRMHSGQFYVSLPMQFSTVTLPESVNWNSIVKGISATIHHPNFVNITASSPSHRLQTERHDKSTVLIATTAKDREDVSDVVQSGNAGRRRSKNHVFEESKSMEPDGNVDAFGRDFELQYNVLGQTLSGTVIEAPITKDRIIEKNTMSHHILITPPAQLSHFRPMPRSICFLIDRSTRLELAWTDIVLAMEQILNGMGDSEMFSITLFDAAHHITWAAANPDAPLQLHPATKEKRSSALEWLGVYKPDKNKLDSALEEPLLSCLSALQRNAQSTGHLPICVLLNASRYDHEKRMVQHILENTANYDAQGFLLQRIFGVSIGAGANPYFLHYLSSMSRGKSVHLTDPFTVKEELDGLLSELEAPLCRDLTVTIGFRNKHSTFNVHEMVHPHPIPDLYKDHAVLLKVTLPDDKAFQIESIQLKGYVLHGNGMLNSLDIPVPTVDHDNMSLNDAFPMELALAQSHLNHLHSEIWLNMDLVGGSESESTSNLLMRANAISDETGIGSPTRVLQSVQEAVFPEESEDSLYGDLAETVSLKRDPSGLSLPPRTGRGARRRKQVSNKQKAAALGIGAMLGSVAVVSVLNPFGGEESIFGEVEFTHGAGACCCFCAGAGCADQEGDCDCGECCDAICVIL